ncbi:o-succinylbenzoate synthase [Arthrobacter sp. NPDC055138]
MIPHQLPDLSGHRDLPELADLLATARVVALPMKVRFRGVTEREVLLLEGPAGWAEFSPFLEYDDVEAAAWLAAAVETGWQGFPAPVRDSVPVNATVPAVSPEQVPGVLARYDGAKTVKIKVAETGQDIAQDVARVAAVRAAAPDAVLRVDANGGWDVAVAVDALTRLAEYSLEYAEQPVPDIAGLRAVRAELRRRGINTPIAADESVRKASDPLRVAREEAADLIVVKVQPLGGVRRALDIVAQAGLRAVVSSALDSSVGIRAGVALAAALPELPYACGLATVSLMGGDVTTESLVPEAGRLPVREVVPDPALLDRFAAPEDRRQWWLDRLARTYRLLEQ